MSTAQILSRGFLALRIRPARSPAAVEMAAETTWSTLAPRGGLVIRCERGAVWITVEGDREDHVVVAPGTFSTGRRGRVAALALEPARVTIERARR